MNNFNDIIKIETMFIKTTFQDFSTIANKFSIKFKSTKQISFCQISRANQLIGFLFDGKLHTQQICN